MIIWYICTRIWQSRRLLLPLVHVHAPAGIFEGLWRCGVRSRSRCSRVDLYVPGCAARPEIIIDGILKCFEKPETLEEPVAVEDPAKDEQEKIEEKPEDVTEEEQDDKE